jgi:exopolysaccharide biosynthesis polyprenyl glycosylphosphotransferase
MSSATECGYKKRRFFDLRVSSVTLCVLLDVLGIVTAYHLTRVTRVALNPYLHSPFDVESVTRFLPNAGLFALLWIVVLFAVGAYRSLLESPWKIIRTASTNTLVAFLLVLVFSFFYQPRHLVVSRSTILIFLFYSFLLLVVLRIGFCHILRALKKSEAADEHVVVIGTGKQAARMRELLTSGDHLLTFDGFVSVNGAESHDSTPEVIGNIAVLPEIINKRNVKQVIIADESIDRNQIHSCINTCHSMGVKVDAVPALFGLAGSRAVTVSLDGASMVRLQPLRLERRDLVIKRVMDVILSLIFLPVILPVLGVSALLIKLTSKGPLFYTGSRVGVGGRHFPLVKLRTMCSDAHNMRKKVEHMNKQSGALFKIGNDPRVTRVGWLLRRFSVDELPQIFNVLRGDMSLVGPRPLPWEDLECRLPEEARCWASQRHNVLPGITCLWQVSGRSGLSFEDMVLLDIEYIQNWSLWLDLKILLRTMPAVFFGRGAQ